MTLTYIFKVTHFKTLLSWKQWELAKMLKYDFIEVDICDRTGPLQTSYIDDFDLHFESQTIFLLCI